MPQRRAVVYGRSFLDEVERLFPASGAADGRPTSGRLFDAVMPAVTEAFARDFEGLLAEHPDSPIRMVLTAQTPFFPSPLVFYALLVDTDTVEIVDVIVDDEFLDTWDEDLP
jgi:hypothetical protein